MKTLTNYQMKSVEEDIQENFNGFEYYIEYANQELKSYKIGSNAWNEITAKIQYAIFLKREKILENLLVD
jgi:hypothetical protein